MKSVFFGVIFAFAITHSCPSIPDLHGVSTDISWLFSCDVAHAADAGQQLALPLLEVVARLVEWNNPVSRFIGSIGLLVLIFLGGFVIIQLMLMHTDIPFISAYRTIDTIYGQQRVRDDEKFKSFYRRCVKFLWLPTLIGLFLLLIGVIFDYIL